MEHTLPMRIMENTPDRLVIVDKPIFTAALLWIGGAALLFVSFSLIGGPFDLLPIISAACGFFLVFLAWRCLPFITVEFDRTSARITRRFKRINGTKEDHLPLAEARRAGFLQTLFGTGGLRRVALNPSEKPFHLEYGLIGLDRRNLVVEINRWLGSVR